MTIKERFNIRMSRIKEYKQQKAKCREIASKLSVDNIRVEFEDDQPEPNGCIKIKIYRQGSCGDDISYTIKHCENFNETSCPITNCFYHKEYEKYRQQLHLLYQAKSAKRAALKRVFQRIK